MTKLAGMPHQQLRSEFRALPGSQHCYHSASVFDPMSAQIAAGLGFEVGIWDGSVAALQVSGGDCQRKGQVHVWTGIIDFVLTPQ